MHSRTAAHISMIGSPSAKGRIVPGLVFTPGHSSASNSHHLCDRACGVEGQSSTSSTLESTGSSLAASEVTPSLTVVPLMTRGLQWHTFLPSPGPARHSDGWTSSTSLEPPTASGGARTALSLAHTRSVLDGFALLEL